MTTNTTFLEALKSAITGRETSTDRLSAKDQLPVLVHSIQIEGQPIKVRIATDTRCSAVNEFLQKYSDEALQLSQTSSTRKLLLKDTKIPNLFIYEVKVAPPKEPRPAKSPKLVEAIKKVEAVSTTEPVYAAIPDFQEPEVKPAKPIKRK